LVFQTSGNEEHALQAPQGIAIAPNGNLYVANALTDTVEIFSPDGEWIDSIGETGTGPGQFQFHQPGGESELGDVGFDADGNLYVFDTMNHRIQKFAPDHTFLLEWGRLGAENGEFDEVTGAVDPRAGLVYVTDLGNRVQVFDLDGNFLDKWGSTGSGPSKFRKPTNVAVDSQGNVYIAEEDGRRVQKFDPYGSFLDSTGSSGTMAGDFGQIFAIAVDANDYLYVAGYTDNTIQILAPDGSLVGVIDTIDGAGTLSQPSGLAIGPDGALYVSEEGNNRIIKLQLPPLDA
jgi:DNA-binding beta-propeller fold protein YncE